MTSLTSITSVLEMTPVPFTGKRLPPPVCHECIECPRRGEFQELDLQRLPACSGAPGPLQYLAAVPRNEAQDLVFVSDQAILGTRPRPQQHTRRQVHGADPCVSRILTECPAGGWRAAIRGKATGRIIRFLPQVAQGPPVAPEVPCGI